MRLLSQSSKRFAGTVGALGILSWAANTIAGEQPSYRVAYFSGSDDPLVVTTFPILGEKTLIRIPGRLGHNFHVIAFSSDGTAMYGQNLGLPGHPAGMTKVDLKQRTTSSVPGSSELGEVWSLIESEPRGRILASGVSLKDGKAQCGAFEIDPLAGALHPLRVSASKNCGDALGPVSPDGRHALSHSGKELALVDLSSGALRTIEGINDEVWLSRATWLNRSSWSPDGHWIAVVHGGRLTVIDADDTSRRKKLGASGSGPVKWSPDSKQLVLSQPQLSCAATLYGESLETVDVQTERRSAVQSSHCQIAGGVFGWLSDEVIFQPTN